MNTLDETFSNRRIYYNYMAPGGTGFECSDSTGVRADDVIYSGFSNISLDNSSTIPTVVFHGNPGSMLDPRTIIAYDGTFYATMGAMRCGFISPTELPSPWTSSGYDIYPKWPKIAQIDTTVFIVSSAEFDTALDNSVIYYRGHISPDWGGYTETVFEPPLMLALDQMGVTCDIAAWSDSSSSKVAIAWVDIDAETETDSCYCEDSPYDAAYIALRTSTDMGGFWSPVDTVSKPGVHIYSDYPDSMVIGYEIDTTTTPPDTSEIYRPVYSRPVDVNVTIDNAGDVHLVWEGLLISPIEGWEYDCAGACSVSVFCRSIIYHWKEGMAGLDTVAIDPTVFYCNSYSGLAATGNSIGPQVAVDDDGDIFVCWEQFYSELLWATGPVMLDRNTEGYENAEIFCSKLSAGSTDWTDPLNISNTYTPNCDTGMCWSERSVTIAEKADDRIHISFIRDSYPGSGFLEPSMSYFYYVEIPDSIFIDTGIPEVDFNGVTMPETFRLGRNFPNPFNAATGFWFDVYEPGHFTVDVVDVLGRTVSRVLDKELKDGRHHFVWDGYADNGWIVPSGTYFLRATDSNGSQFSRKITLIK